MPARSRSPSSTRWAITSTSCYAWTMRRALVLVVLTACAGGSSHEPAWPKQHVSENDGGESLAPRQAHQVAAIGLAKDDDTDARPATVTPAASTPAATTDAATPAATPAAATDETINTEEIIIEIDD